ncbi:MAG: hypothetical protein K2Q03_04885 [Sphingobacteriaceae bacterium]|nr:hypothetical protein [Sphingobacteriaceae bacterium]
MKKINKFMLLGLFALVILGCKKDSIVDAPTNKIGVSSAISAIPSIEQKFNTCSWMQYVSNETSLSDLSIPGTHNSMSFLSSGSNFSDLQFSNSGKMGLAIDVTTKCQDIDMCKQLEYGVRYFDIGCRNNGSDFSIQPDFPLRWFSFDDYMLSFFYTFLRNNPTETIIMCIREENSNTGQNFEDVLLRYISKNPNAWYTKDVTPKMGEVRGKIVLVRELSSRRGIGIPQYDTSIDRKALMQIIQEETVVRDIQSKRSLIDRLLYQVENPFFDYEGFFIIPANGYMPMKRNDLSWDKTEIPNVSAVSLPITKHLVSLFSYYRKRRTGIVQMDFMLPLVCRNIIKTNF